MRRLGLLLSALLVGSVPLAAQAGGSQQLKVVGTCGSLVIQSVNPSTGQPNFAPATMDSTGKACSSASFSGSVTSRDSVVAKAIVVHSCAAQSLSSSGAPEHVVFEDTTGLLCVTTGASGALATGTNHIGRVAVDSILASMTHIGRAAIDSLIGAARIVHACGTQSNSSTGNPYNVVYEDSTGNICTNAATTTVLSAGTAHIGRTATDSVIGAARVVHACGAQNNASTGNPYNPVYEDSTGALCTNATASTTVGLNTGTNHIGRAAIDSFVGATTNGTEPIYAKLDSVPLTTGGSLDSVRTVKNMTYTSKTTPAYANNTFQPLTTDTAGRVRVKIDTAVTQNVAVTGSLPAGTNDLGVVGIDSLPPGGYADSVNMIPHMRWVDSLKLVDSLTTLHHLALVDSINAIRHVDTISVEIGRVSDTVYCAAGAKSAADSVVLPSYGGSTHQFVTWVYIAETDTLGITGTGYDSLTTTNFPIPLLRFGNAAAVGGTNIWLSQAYSYPIVAVSAATATKFRLSAPGAGGYWDLCVGFYHQ